MGRLDEKVAIVTGANSGMGMATVEALSDEGARTAIFLATDESVKDVTGEYFYKCKIAASSQSRASLRLNM
ncbi:SDR family NAD(P)-dependent oxidoreductase [Butyrivibrio sp. WCD3002]|uniref:SDR family NAD(P)-dependent oxidoreductase n=1 Tax=Butyrivibrio sp. WCD3002 TaxID=1280676 RepID=UPI0003F66B12|nr:SDR family NAD(P)-dependent oxidoreductase [Butyrivibrio sp. WCD3002]